MGIDKKRIYDIKIYHNPKCTKSREALSLLEQNNINPKIIHYLDETGGHKCCIPCSQMQLLYYLSFYQSS